MPDMYDNYRMVEEVKERAVSRGSGSTEFESYDRVAKIAETWLLCRWQERLRLLASREIRPPLYHLIYLASFDQGNIIIN